MEWPKVTFSAKPPTRKDTTVVTGLVRFNYVYLLEPRSFEGQEPTYSATILIRKDDDETLSLIYEAIHEATEQGKARFWGNKVPPNLRNPLRDGDEERPEDPNYANMYFINAKSKNKIQIYDKLRQPIDNPAELYSGFFGRAILRFYPYNQAGNRGVGVALNAVQKIADGPTIGPAMRPEEAFESVDGIEDIL